MYFIVEPAKGLLDQLKLVLRANVGVLNAHYIYSRRVHKLDSSLVLVGRPLTLQDGSVVFLVMASGTVPVGFTFDTIMMLYPCRPDPFSFWRK